jgi:long-chain fatty acid transport protein
MPPFNSSSQSRRRASLATYLFVLSFTSAPGLLAQDFFGAGVSAQTAAQAGIYIPSGENALDALSLNPAGLSSLTGTVVNISALGVLARGNFSNPANSDSPMRLSGGVVPYGAIGLPLGNRWTVGVGFMPDLLSSSKWQFRDSPGVAGADYGAQNEKSQILGFRTAAGVAYRVSSRISAGATVGVIYNSNTLIMPYVFQNQPELKGLKTLLDLHTTGVGWNSSFGVTARLSSRWALGASYRTRSSITSNGSATGNMGAQFAALQIPFSPDFSYHAQVAVQVPQAALLNAAWQKSPVLRFSLQSTWTNWKQSFASLPVSLSNGTNSDINGFLQTNAIKDVVPLAWKDQFSFRAAAERKVGESFSVSGGYIYQNSPVPSSTLSPMTAAIMKNGLTTGAGFSRGRARFDVAYQLNLTAGQSVGVSGLLSGEFSQSRVNLGTQALTLSTSFHL